jgi:Domain of unknown function (DUF4917)
MATAPVLLSFEGALQRTEEGKVKHVLLGNGFSRACRNDIFAYEALFTRADFRNLPNAQLAFAALNTTDFEKVMNALRMAALLIPVYAPTSPALAVLLNNEAEALREVLASAIAQNHPERPSDIHNEQYAACRSFLNNFKSVYTLNYDLLLYWTIMQRDVGQHLTVGDDGFRTPDEGEAEYVTWDVEKTDDQDVFYLHGALHLYDAGSELKKFTWVNTGVRLIEQVREALELNMFPLIVAEGSSQEKMARVQHSNYLGRGYRSFAKITGSLYIYGFAMSQNDEHWLRLIDRNRKLRKLFVGIYGQPDSPANRDLIARCNMIGATRPERSSLEIRYFDAASARVWG